MPEPYQVYVMTYGKVKSGKLLDKSDYLYPSESVGGLAEYDEKGNIAVSLAAQDVSNNIDLRSKSDFNKELERLLK